MNEAQIRWVLGREAIIRGRGGLSQVQRLTGISRPTIIKGMREVAGKRPLKPFSGVRRSGGGRKDFEHYNPGFESALKKIMEENTAGDPMSPLRWTQKSTQAIADQLKEFDVTRETVRLKLLELDYSMQSNFKNKEGFSPANRDEQFRYINELVKKYQAKGWPVLSVDCKKKEKIGEFKNQGQSWRPKGKPIEVNVHDFPNLAEGKAIPYGAYDVSRNEGFVNVGIDHETSEFAVESIRRWWKYCGEPTYGGAKKLLICADGGGSNGKSRKAWKYHLQQFANNEGLSITVCHYPKGTSKWNKIEHRMFSFISLQWKGQPLVSHETVIKLIGSTTTKTGLKIKAKLDRRKYALGQKFTDAQMDSIKIERHETQPDLNYTIRPNR
jgi:Rhodopirellula transposase DDE domain